MINWNDKAPYEFLKEYATTSEKNDLRCSAAELEFKIIGIEDIVKGYRIKNGKPTLYKTYPKRIEMYQRRIKKNLPIGTLFCRVKKDKYFVKDGNHRLKALIAEGVEEIRIAFDKNHGV